MIGVIVAGHGEFASELISTAEKVVGKQKYIKAVSVKVGEEEDNLREKLNAVLRMTEISKVIVLVDIFGSSFCNTCMNLTEGTGDVDIVSGVNLPMLIKVLTYRNSFDLRELVSLACKGGKEGILDIREWQEKIKQLKENSVALGQSATE